MPGEPAAMKPASAAADDAFAALPDEILQHVLSFLPAQLAVRTCVLARRWRRLWEGAAGLRITAANASEPRYPPALGRLREFVDHLLLLRGSAPLDSCEFMFDVLEDADVPHVNLWIRHVVVRCQVRRLQLTIARNESADFPVDNLSLVSRHLRRLELNYIELNDNFLDLSGCPGLEDLYINESYILAKRISSKSVKHLTINDSSFSAHVRTIIDVPSTISLRLDNPLLRTPVLGSMPLLAVAFIRLGTDTLDYVCYNSESGDCDDEHCKWCYDLGGETFNGRTANGAKRKKSVLLNGLSEAKSLVLIDESETISNFIFKRDVKRCPMFTMLKTLLLNEYWCVPPDFHELTCLLEHSPVLEKLTLQLFSEGPKHNVEMEGSVSSAVQSAAISKYLKIIEIKCKVVDERVAEVQKFLCTFIILEDREEGDEVQAGGRFSEAAGGTSSLVIQ